MIISHFPGGGGEPSIPDGMIASINSVSTWLECAGIDPESAGNPSLAAVVADSALCAALMNSQNAVNYMLRSSNIRSAVLGSGTAIAALDGSSPIVTPQMTGNNSPSWLTASSNGIKDPVSNAYKATGTGFELMGNIQNNPTLYVRLSMTNHLYVYKIKLRAFANNDAGFLYSIRASNDAQNWTTLVSNQAATIPGQTEAMMTYTPANMNGYKHYEVSTTAQHAYGGYYACRIIRYLTLYGKRQEAIA